MASCAPKSLSSASSVSLRICSPCPSRKIISARSDGAIHGVVTIAPNRWTEMAANVENFGGEVSSCCAFLKFRERAARAADVTSWNRSRCPCVATAIPGRRGQFREMALPWMLGTRRAIFRAYTLRAAGTGGPLGRGPDCVFTGTGNRSEPALAGYRHFGGSSDEPLKPYRSYPADLTSGP